MSMWLLCSSYSAMWLYYYVVLCGYVVPTVLCGYITMLCYVVTIMQISDYKAVYKTVKYTTPLERSLSMYIYYATYNHR